MKKTNNKIAAIALAISTGVAAPMAAAQDAKGSGAAGDAKQQSRKANPCGPSNPCGPKKRSGNPCGHRTPAARKRKRLSEDD